MIAPGAPRRPGAAPVLNTPMAGVKHAPNRRRPHFVGVWLTGRGFASIETRRQAAGLSRSDMLRAMLAYADERMPGTPTGAGVRR
jgi:hypothetical protein